jgi:hypothetical protein
MGRKQVAREILGIGEEELLDKVASEIGDIVSTDAILNQAEFLNVTFPE